MRRRRGGGGGWGVGVAGGGNGWVRDGQTGFAHAVFFYTPVRAKLIEGFTHRLQDYALFVRRCGGGQRIAYGVYVHRLVGLCKQF